MTESKWIRNWFSNMIPFDEPLIHEGISYLAPENFYQAMKTLDVGKRKEIAAASPRKSKQIGRLVELRADGLEAVSSQCELLLIISLQSIRLMESSLLQQRETLLNGTTGEMSIGAKMFIQTREQITSERC